MTPLLARVFMHLDGVVEANLVWLRVMRNN